MNRELLPVPDLHPLVVSFVHLAFAHLFQLVCLYIFNYIVFLVVMYENHMCYVTRKYLLNSCMIVTNKTFVIFEPKLLWPFICSSVCIKAKRSIKTIAFWGSQAPFWFFLYPFLVNPTLFKKYFKPTVKDQTPPSKCSCKFPLSKPCFLMTLFPSHST